MSKAITSIDGIKIKTATNIRLPEYEEHRLSGVPVYVMRGLNEPVLQLELIFDAGRIHTDLPALAPATASMLNEGTKSRTSREIAEEIEYYGSTVRCNAGTDAMSINVYCMTRYFRETLEIVEDILSNAVFPERELELYKANREQKLEILFKQNEYVANRYITKGMFGDHTYGYFPSVEDIRSLDRESIRDHYRLVGSSNLTAFLCGDVGSEELETLTEMIARFPQGRKATPCEPPQRVTASATEFDGPQHMQCSIRLGRSVIPRRDPGFASLYFLNTIFGGFFGSRLMKNIREELGLTYNISSSIETLSQASSLIISTEASSQNRDVVLDEIRKEMTKLCENEVSQKEFDMVKNYLMGSLMMQLDGPFRTMDVVKTLHMEDVEPSAFDQFVNNLRAMTPEVLRRAACEYLNWDDFHRVVVY